MSTPSPERLLTPTMNTTPESSDSDGLEMNLSAEISEIVPQSPGENSSGASASSGAQAKQQKRDEAAQRYKQKAQRLKASTPPTKLLVKEIRGAILEKLKDLQVEQKRAIRSKGRGFAKYNEVVAQMRTLKKIGASLLYKTYEDLKTIWLKIVHDIV